MAQVEVLAAGLDGALITHDYLAIAGNRKLKQATKG